MEAPRRPVSTDGLDGRWTGVAREWESANLIDRWLGTGPEGPATAVVDEVSVTAMQVEAPPRAAGPLDGILGAILGFLFG